MDKETLRMQMLSGVITESEYKAKLEEFKKDSLNEHYVAGGIVGIGAINQIPSRAKADYEDAFEHFLGQKYSLNEMEKEVEEDLQQSDVKSAIDGKKLDLKKLEDATKKAMSGDSTDLTLFLAGVFEGEEKSLYEANPLEGGPGYMTKYRIGVLSALIKDAEEDLIKWEGDKVVTPELTEKMKGTIEKLKSSREALKAQYREETGKDI